MPNVTQPESTTPPAIEKAQKVSEELPPIENINIASKVEEALAAPGLPMPTPEAEKIVEAPLENPSEPPAPAVGEVKSKDHLEKSLDSLIDNVDNREKAPNDSPKKKTMEETIVADDLYVAPPAYDQLGRGLVYNCKEKFWACVNKFAYVVCNKNMKWNSSHKKSTECAVNSVYNSEEDCSVVQKYNVSTSKITPFCQ